MLGRTLSAFPVNCKIGGANNAGFQPGVGVSGVGISGVGVSSITISSITTSDIARRDALPCVSSTHRGDTVRRPRWITPCKPKAQLGVSHPLLYELRSSSTRYGVEQRE
jgi:hypothetical protein